MTIPTSRRSGTAGRPEEHVRAPRPEAPDEEQQRPGRRAVGLRATNTTSSQPAWRIGPAIPTVTQANRTSATAASTTPPLTGRARPDRPVEAERGERHAGRPTAAPEPLVGHHDLAQDARPTG